MAGQVKDIFLVYKDGRAIKHLTNEFDPTRDSQVLSSMFSAIQAFAEDSFKKGLRSMDFEDRKICIERGEQIYVAVVSVPDADARKLAYDLVRRIEHNYSTQLQDWTGDLNSFPGLDKILNRAFGENYTSVFADWPAMPAE
jgi:hypothetical protein